MKVTNEKTENRQAFLTIEMDPAELEASLQQAYRHLVKTTAVPGFRKGKAPRAVLERHLGRANLMDDALNHHLIPEGYEKALEETKLEPIAQPALEITQTEPSVIFKVTVPLSPNVKLGDYHQVRVERQPVSVSDIEVDDVLDELRHEQAVWEPVERTVKMGDMVNVDVEGTIGEKPFVKQEGMQYHVQPDDRFPIPDFFVQLIDLEPGKEKEFKVTMPGDRPDPEVAGKEALFKVKVTEVKEEKLPELNDEFARTLGEEYTDFGKLQEKVRATLIAREEDRVRRIAEDQAIDEVIKVSEMEFPPVLVERELDRLIDQRMGYWRMRGGTLSDYLKMTNQTEEQLRTELRTQAESRVKQSLVVTEIAAAEKIEVNDGEIDAEIDGLIKATAEKERADAERSFKTEGSRRSVRAMLLSRKAVQRLVDIATTSDEKKETVKEEAK